MEAAPSYQKIMIEEKLRAVTASKISEKCGPVKEKL